jgi:N-acetylglucosaminyldiphosphoundecaprenol N-acetyl-beta-D-mannosaminyltransferase
MSEVKKSDILGISIELLKKQEVRALCGQWLDSLSFHQIVTVNPEFLMEARKNKDFLRVLQNADARITDGFGLVLISFMRYGIEGKLSRVTGVECVGALSELCVCMKKSMYIIGGDPGIAQKATKTLKSKFPELIIAGAEEGVPKQGGGSDDELCKRISASNADILLVAFGSPKQDIWIAKNKEKLTGIKIAVGVGGTCDYLAGIVPYAPKIVRALGLEWLFRLVTQPQRLNRIITAVIRFPLAVLREKCYKK